MMRTAVDTIHYTRQQLKPKFPGEKSTHFCLQKQQRTGVANLISYRGVQYIYTVYMYIGAISRWLCSASATGDP